jgi:hypothetical protein
MNKSGFWLTSLTLTGSNVSPAEISFSNGLNVISGPSDTGKTFIAQCINFILGESKTPETGPEAMPYELVSVGLRGSMWGSSGDTIPRGVPGTPYLILKVTSGSANPLAPEPPVTFAPKFPSSRDQRSAGQSL